LLLALVACGGMTPPGPNMVYGQVKDRASYLLLDWQEGLRILMWDDIVDGGHQNSGSGSTTDPVFRQRGGAQAADGRNYEYRLETRDGEQADFTIDGNSYDLEDGSLFLIRTAGGETQVEQMDVDLSGLTPTNEGIIEFAGETPEIDTFLSQDGAAIPEINQTVVTTP
jgi:hypothetical protein